MRTLRTITSALLLLAMLAFVAASCTSSHQARKCNGQKAIRTPMGPM
jgi:hypothetical protein